MRLCFLVKTRKARGRSVGGGRRIGKIGAATLLLAGRNAGGASGRRCAAGRMGCAGVPNAGEDEKMGPSEGLGGASIMCVVVCEVFSESSNVALTCQIARSRRGGRVTRRVEWLARAFGVSSGYLPCAFYVDPRVTLETSLLIIAIA